MYPQNEKSTQHRPNQNTDNSKLLLKIKEQEEYIQYLEELREIEHRVINLTREELKEAKAALKAHEHIEEFMQEERRNAQAEIEAQRQVQILSDLESKERESFLQAQASLANYAVQEIEQKNSSLKKILKINQSISSVLHLNQLLQEILHIIIKTLEVERAALLLSRSGNILSPRAYYKISQMELDDPLFQDAWEIIKLAQQQQESQLRTKSEGENHLSMLAIPLLYEKESIGVLYADTSNPKRALRKADLTLGEIFCSQAAISISRAHLYHQIQQRVITDDFLGIGNRRRLEEDVRKEDKLSLALFNIDNFSFINGAYGHDAGDFVLLEMVSRVQNFLAAASEEYQASLYRLTSDEFVILSKLAFFPIERLKQDIRNHLQLNPFIYNDIILNISFSIGVVQNESQDLLRKANVAMRHARLYGRGKFYVYAKDRDLAHQYRDYLFWMNKLKKYITYDKIIPFFQPLLDNKSGQIVSHECLLRIKEDDQILEPNRFLNVARQIGIFPHLTIIMIDKSFDYFKNRKDNFSINFSPEDLDLAKFLRLIEKKLVYTGIEPQRVTFEILEGLSEEKDSEVFRFIRELRNMGFKVAIDDFGKAYSNFSRFISTEVDYLKIDGSFIQDILSNTQNEKMVRALTEFSHNMGIRVVAEYVQNREIFNKILELNIDYSQGEYVGQAREDVLEGTITFADAPAE